MSVGVSGGTSTGAGAAVAMPQAPVSEFRARNANGLLVLAVCIVVLIGVSVLLKQSSSGTVVDIGIALIVVTAIALCGLTPVAPGQARVITLFGRYSGTVRTTGLRWVNPFTTRRRISTRIRNHETVALKVNDADGNPIEMAAVVVWHVADTAKAAYAVDDFVRFVAIQAETAVRHVAGSYPYDSRRAGALSLRENAAEITSRMSAEIAERATAAGVTVIESRISRLSYAPEIAQAMLRRQQADAVVAARERLVEGAVGMVRMALDAIAEQGLVELDEERKASMVSNLLVVLCSEQATQPVVNTGTLYQ